ncbi:MAG: hypothetical protein JW793_16025 [Acidobacteria bacterium]|nr:hypothetical protein [Acidobacteriota bacterium]
MIHKKSHRHIPTSGENESLESILDILDSEMAAAGPAPTVNDPSKEPDSLAADLLDYLKTEN